MYLPLKGGLLYWLEKQAPVSDCLSLSRISITGKLCNLWQVFQSPCDLVSSPKVGMHVIMSQ